MATSKLSPQEQAIALANAGKNYSEISRELGKSRSTVRRWVEETPTASGELNATIDRHESDARTILTQKEEIRELRVALTTARKATLDDIRASQILTRIADIPNRTPTWLLKPHTMKDFGVPVFFLSDFHWSENVEPSEINGTNQYDMKIARKRLRVCFERAAGLIMSKPGYNPKNGAIMLLGGDMVSGDIHDELKFTNDVPSMCAVLDLTDELVGLIKQFVKTIAHKLHILCVTGNHGRTDIKPRAKRRNYTNWDWMIYKILQRELHNVPGVTMEIPDGPDVFFNAHGWPCMLTHGDQLGVKGGDGIIGVIGPITRGDFKVRVQAMGEGRTFRTTFMGHYHSSIVIPSRLVVNASLIGTNEYSRNMLRVPPAPPTQTLVIMHGMGGITGYDQIYVDDRMAAVGAYDKIHAFEPTLSL